MDLFETVAEICRPQLDSDRRDMKRLNDFKQTLLELKPPAVANHDLIPVCREIERRLLEIVTYIRINNLCHE